MPVADQITDEEIIQKISAGEHDLYSVIIDRYQDKLLRYAMSLIRDRDKATDIVQETFTKAFINLKSLNISKSFSSWIYRITHNEAVNAIKKHKREIPIPEDFDTADETNLENKATERETREQVEKCLDQIPILYSEPLVLFYLEDKSYEEISDILRLPIGTVGTRIRRARNLMRKICQKN